MWIRRIAPLQTPRTVLLLLALLAACDNKPKPAPAIGVAHAGPATLTLRQDIALNSQPAGTVQHGERLDIVQRRRRFLKVRTSKGVEGWTDERLVISAEEMAGLSQLAHQAKSMPAQGVATTYGPLNIHITPNRLSPSFLQVKEGEKMDVLMRRIVARDAPATRKISIVDPPALARKPKAKPKKKADDIPLPPMPVVPKPPDNWIEISKNPAANDPGATKSEPKNEPEPPAQEEWSLIRISTGQSGWVLTRRLVMAIPDEVAQYAEGRRIVSYFPLGEILDNGLKDATSKQQWLWTTVERPLTPYDFDSFRVFVWSLRRHRYETAHIERNLKGFAPVLLQTVDTTPKSNRSKESKSNRSAKEAPKEPTTAPGFSILVEKKDGKTYRRRYAFLGNVVRYSGEDMVLHAAPAPQPESGQLVAETRPQDPTQDGGSVYDRLKRGVGNLRRRWFGK